MELLTNEQLLERGTDALEKIRGGIQFSFNKFQQLQQQIRQITPQPINRVLDTVAEGVEYVAEKTPFGIAERGATEAGAMVGEATGSEALGQAVGFGLGLAIPGPEISQAAKPVIPKGIKPKATVQPPTSTPMGPAPAMALAGGRGSIKLQQVAPTDLAPTSMPITVSENWRAPGAAEGIAKSSEWKGVLDFWSKEREKLSTKAGELTSLDLKKRAKKYVDKLYDYTSTDPRVKSVFGSKVKGLERPKFSEQHHLIPKKFTNDIIEKMMEVGDMDDVTNLWMYAAKMETAIGGAIENFTIKPGQAYMRTVPHSKLHVVTRSADKQALDSIKTATNADDLMEIFHNYITTNLPKNKELAKRFSEESLVVAREMGRESNKPAFFNRLMMPRSGQF